MDNHDLDNAMMKLTWSLGGQWSVSLTPAEAQAVLDKLADAAQTGTVDAREWRPEKEKTLTQEELRRQRTFGQHKRNDQGDPGDEQPDVVYRWNEDNLEPR